MIIDYLPTQSHRTGAPIPSARPAHQSSIINHPSSMKKVGPGRFELPTSPLSGVRSSQLSYEPIIQRQLACLTKRCLNWLGMSVYTFVLSKEQQKKPLLKLPAVITLHAG
jgi:hypothetical protein